MFPEFLAAVIVIWALLLAFNYFWYEHARMNAYEPMELQDLIRNANPTETPFSRHMKDKHERK